MKALNSILVAVVLFVAFGLAGSADYAEQVVYNMDETIYETIVDKLGEDCSQHEIATEYMNNKKHYDSIRY